MEGSMKFPTTRSGFLLPLITIGICFAVTTCFTARECSALDSGSSLNPVGSGARAAGMGGAFIGIADDATAASWNPAGLVQLEKPEFSVVYGYFNRDQSFSVTNGSQDTDANGINYASFAYPFTLLSKNMVVSVNYQRLYEMNKDYSFPVNLPNPGGSPITGDFKAHQKGYLSTITPALAIQVIPELYVGVAVNIWDDFLGTSSWDENTSFNGSTGGLPFSRTTNDKLTFSGLNVTPGFLVNLGKLSIGGVVKTPFTADVKRTGTTVLTSGGPASVSASDANLEWDMPMSAGLGLAYRFNDNWTVGLDGYWTQWSEYVIRDASGAEFNPITTNPIAQGRLKDTTQVRLGTEYLFIKGKNVIPVRAGVFYDPQPGASKVDDYYGFSLGSGYTFEKYSLDIAYQFRRGVDVTAIEYPNNGVTSNITQHTVLASLIYRF
jgi:long-subunit fatty acid transport protein